MSSGRPPRRNRFVGWILVCAAAFAAWGSAAGSSAADAAAPASFPAGTLVMTPEGPVPVDALTAGAEIISLDPGSGERTSETILELASRFHSGAVVEIETDSGDTVTATPNHAFWVVRGSRLSSRNDAPGDSRGFGGDGRWVPASDLRRGDELLTITGMLSVENVAERDVAELVYDVRVSGIGAIAVGPGVIAGDLTRDARPVTTRSGGGGGCFVAGTMVATSVGAVAIEEVEPGDQVWAADPRTGAWELVSVTRFVEHAETGTLVEIDLPGGPVVATPNHPFWMASAPGRWKEAGDIVAGDELLSRSGAVTVRSARVQALAPGETIRVFNLEVAGPHTYAVGAAGVLVHNEKEMESAEAATGEERPEAALGTRGSEAPEDAPGWATDESDDFGEAAPDRSTAARRTGAGVPTESGLSAGYSDDNLEFGAYLRFLEEYADAAPHIPIDVRERIVFTVIDSEGLPVSNATVTVNAGGRELVRGTTYSDGSFLFFPAEYGQQGSYDVEVEYRGRTQSLQIERNGRREHTVSLAGPRQQLQQVPLDVLFVLDTTGSMGEEIQRLTQSIEIIHLNLTSLSTNPLVRFGMVLYKDRGDEYVTRTVPLTPDVETFRAQLQEVFASGGGDYPEDLQAALGAATRQIDWDPNGVRLVFIITDAPPQLYADQTFTYADAAHAASRDGIRLFTVGTGGMDIQGEYPLRQLSQYTGAKYIFLTYGETGESEGGRPGSVSHHTGANYETDKLEAIIIRFAKEELQYLSDTPVELAEPYFQAEPPDAGDRDAVLQELFSSALAQLLAYSSWKIPDAAPLAVIPFHASDPDLGVPAEYLSEQLLLTIRQDEIARERFRLVERRDMQSILEEIEFQMSGLASGESATRVGEFLGAQLLLSGTLYGGDENYELFLRLLRVETGEVLAVTKAIVDRALVP